MTPEAAMRLALRAARRVEGRTHPNPPVGAIVFRGDIFVRRADEDASALVRSHSAWALGRAHQEDAEVDLALGRAEQDPDASVRDAARATRD